MQHLQAYTNQEESNVTSRQLSYNEDVDYGKHEQSYRPTNVVVVQYNA